MDFLKLNQSETGISGDLTPNPPFFGSRDPYQLDSIGGFNTPKIYSGASSLPIEEIDFIPQHPNSVVADGFVFPTTDNFTPRWDSSPLLEAKSYFATQWDGDELLGAKSSGVNLEAATSWQPTFDEQLTAIEQAKEIAKEKLKTFLKETDFPSQLELAFGEKGGNGSALDLIQKFIDSSYPNEIQFEILENTLHGRGAFAAASPDEPNTIYLDASFVRHNKSQPQAIAKVILEEVGHYLDFCLNKNDSPGDEGAIFSALVNTQPLDETQLAALKAEDDRATLTIDGQTRYLEYSSAEPGVFTVGDTGQVTIDFLADAGSYQGELGIFSLQGMESLTPGSTEFIREAASRALSNSNNGHVVISDRDFGSRFSGKLGEKDRNTGTYGGEKTFSMSAGEEFAFLLVPKGTVQEVFTRPDIGGSKQPLFSIAAANPDSSIHFGQLVAGARDGAVLGVEDERTDRGSDLDYNDLIFQVSGATGQAKPIEELMAAKKDWRNTQLGKQLVEYAKATGTFDESAASASVRLAELVSPTISANLFRDTAPNNTTNTDKITFDPTIVGQIVGTNRIKKFEAGFDNTPKGKFVDVSSALKPDGSFTLDRALLERIYGKTLPDGSYVLHLQAKDERGNSDKLLVDVSFTLDTTAPAAPQNLDLLAASDNGVSDSDNITSNTTPTIAGTATAGVEVQLFSDGQSLGQTTANTNGDWQITTSALTVGERTLSATATDAAGNVSATSTPLHLTIASNTPAPAAPSNLRLTAATDTGASSSDNITKNSSPTIQGNATAGLSVKLFKDGQLVGQTTANTNGDWQLSAGTLADGQYAFTATAEDSAGRASSLSTSLAVTVDTTAPLAPDNLDLLATSDSGESATDNVTNNPTPEIAGTAAVDAVVQLLDRDGQLLGETTANASGEWQLTTNRLTDSSHTLTATATDVAGNVSDASVALNLTVDTAAPNLNVTAPTANAKLTTGAHLVGTVEGTGTTIAGLDYQWDNLGAIALSASASGDFDRELNFQGLTYGSHSLTITARDLAGNTATSSLPVTWTQKSDVVLDWNATLLKAIGNDKTAVPLAARNMATVHAAIYDAVNGITKTHSTYHISAVAPTDASPEAAAASAAHRVLVDLYPTQTATFDAAFATSLADIPDSAAEDAGVAFGQRVADNILAWRSADEAALATTYTPVTQPGNWQPTAPNYQSALLPQWSSVTPFAMTSSSQFLPDGPPALDSTEYATDFNQVKELGKSDSTTRTAEQTQIAKFWEDSAGTYTPAGHWNEIAETVARQQGNTLEENARLFALLNVGLADAGIAAWDAKYTYNSWRPITAIGQADTDNNSQTAADPNWTSLLATPPFPEYVSGHSTYSGAADAILTDFFGDNIGFTATSLKLPGVERSFDSFTDAADEAGMSRIYGGIHFMSANQDGLAMGRELGEYVFQSFFGDTTPLVQAQLTRDTAPGGATNADTVTSDPSINGVITDVGRLATLKVGFDDTPAEQFVDVTASVDASGNFTFDRSKLEQIFGSTLTDGAYVLHLQATDNQNKVSTADVSFTLDTAAPDLTLSSFVNQATLFPGSRLVSAMDGTGSSLASLSYQFDDLQPHSTPLNNSSASFDQYLNYTGVNAGAHTLKVALTDAAGNVTTQSFDVTVDLSVPFQVTGYKPVNGAIDVGATYRPQVFFSQPIDPSSLNENNFYASFGGEKLPATIVPANDGTFAWLFFKDTLPDASRIRMTVDGSTIRAAAGGTVLDADADGNAGGVLNFDFTTVSLVPVAGTSLSGIVVDPGPDLKPHTADDSTPGADGYRMTQDDVFSRPIAGVKVYLLGLEDQYQITDANGRFKFDAVPIGNVKLAVDGMTATSTPEGMYFPEMVMDVNVKPGVQNYAMPDMQEIYLPRLSQSILQNVDPNGTTKIAAPDVATPELTAEQRQYLTIEVQPNSMTGADGQRLSAGQVGISTVPAELVRDMLPPGVLQHTFDITVQAPGIATFATPAPMTFPNVFNAEPGTQLNFLSFDHTTGRLVIEGTATVSADGKYVATDPGTGITHPGWHGLTPPGGCGTGSPPPQTPPPTPQDTVEEHDVTVPMPDENDDIFTETVGFIFDEVWSAPNGLNPTVPPPPSPRCGGSQNLPSSKNQPYLKVTIQTDAPSDASIPVDDSEMNQSFILAGGSSEIKQFNGIAPVGSKVTITEENGAADGSKRIIKTNYYLGRSADVSNSNQNNTQSGFRNIVSNSIQTPGEDQASNSNNFTVKSSNGGMRKLLGDTSRDFMMASEVSSLEDEVGILDNSAVEPTSEGFLELHKIDSGDPVDTVGFEAVAINGGVKTLNFVLANVSNQPLTLGELFINGGSGQFSLTGVNKGQVIEPGNQIPISVTFTPTIFGVDEATLIIDSDTQEEPLAVIPLTGSGGYAQARASLNASNNNLGGVHLGEEPLSNNQLFTITNNGIESLIISKLSLAEGTGRFTLLGLPINLATNPISLASGESFTFGAQFNPDHTGLDRALIDIETNDPTQPVLRVSAVGTGLDNVVYPDWGNDFIAVDTPDLAGSQTLRTVSDNGGNFEVFLPPEQYYDFSAFDPVTGLIGRSTGVTPQSGGGVNLTATTVFGASIAPDTDYDGLPDDIEHAIGTSTTNTDTNKDGISDYAAIAQRIDPLGEDALPIGIVGTVQPQGNSFVRDVVASSNNAYLAAGTSGLQVVDISRMTKPAVTASVPTSALGGDALAVASASIANSTTGTSSNLVAVALGNAGLAIVDATDPPAAKVLGRIQVPGSALCVEISDTLAYVGGANGLVSVVDLKTRELLSSFQVAGSSDVSSIKLSGGTLYALSGGMLAAYDVTTNLNAPQLLSSLAVSYANHLFVGTDRAYVTGIQTFEAVDITNPANLRVTSGASPSLNYRSLADNGSGRLVVGTTTGFTSDADARAALFNVENPDNTNGYLTEFNTPGSVQDVWIQNGLAFIADGQGGLAVFNYLGFDQGKNAPTIAVSTTSPDGKTAIEGQRLRVDVKTLDDVQTRQVRLVANGVTQEPDGSFPFSFFVDVPKFGTGDNTLTLEVIATDTGGNESTQKLQLEIVKDTVAPQLLSVRPVFRQSQSTTLSSFQATFSEPLALSTVTSDSVRIVGAGQDGLFGTADDVAVALGGFDFRPSRNLLTVRPATPLGPGRYMLQMEQAKITDRTGNPWGTGIFSTQATVRTSYKTVANAGSLVLDDLNRDGKLDLFAANQYYNNVSVQMGNGDAAFTDRTRYTVGERPKSLVVGDLNGDGKLDIVTANSNNNPPTALNNTIVTAESTSNDTVSVLLSNSDGSFAPSNDYAVGSGSESLSLGDVNRDGKLDLVKANSNDDSISVLLGNGSGSFTSRVDYPVGSSPSSMLLGDVNQDGVQDIALTNNSDKVSVLLGNGDGSFAPNVDYTVGDNPDSIALGDVNGDNNLDLVTANVISRSVSVLLGNGKGSFTAGTNYATNKSPESMALGDVNGDGELDLLVGSPGYGYGSDSVVSILLGNGDGSFTPGDEYAVRSTPESIVTGDLDGDGDLDIVTANAGDDSLSVLLGNGDGSFISETGSSSAIEEVG